MVAQYIATRTILNLCERDTRQPGARVSWWWWEYDRIYLEGVEKQAADTTTILVPESENEADVESNRDSGGEEELLDMPHTCLQSIKTTSLSKIFRTRGSTFPRAILRTHSVRSNH